MRNGDQPTRDFKPTAPHGIDDEALYKTFVVEANERLAEMGQALVALEVQPDNDDLLGTIFRHAHTLKGNAASLEFSQVADVSHALEDVLGRLRNRTLSVSGELINVLLQAVEVLQRLVIDAVAGGREGVPECAELLGQLGRYVPGQQAER